MTTSQNIGLAVTGIVHPDQILTNSGVQKGDILILTKPLGTGVLFNACRAGKLPYRELEAILPNVAALNRASIETALKFDVHACTDVTGFAILGHTLEMARGSGVRIDLFYDRLPFHPNALEMYQQGETTGSNEPNRELVEGFWENASKRSSHEEELLFDPQTSGGLLLAVPESQAKELVARLTKAGVQTAACVGKAVASTKPLVRVV